MTTFTIDKPIVEDQVRVRVGQVTLAGTLGWMSDARGLVLFAHGSGSSRYSPRNRYVAETLQHGQFATLLIDLLTAEEEGQDIYTAQYRFDIPLLSRRLVGIAEWLTDYPATQQLAIGCFGASTGAGAALIAAAQRPEAIRAVVSRGGRPDLAGAALAGVRAPTLLIVGGNDPPVIAFNQKALARLRTKCKLEIIPGATHLFPEPGTLETAARLAREWFERYL